MGEKISFLFSDYTLDGIRMSLTPAQMFAEVSEEGVMPQPPRSKVLPVIDETLDTAPLSRTFNPADIGEFLDVCSRGRDSFPLRYSPSHACLKAAEALIDAIWKTGHFQLGDLSLRTAWKWDPAPIGNMASLYSGVEAVTSYLDGLGVRIGGLSFSEGPCSLSFKVTPSAEDDRDPRADLPWEMPFKTTDPVIGRKRRCPDKMLPEGPDWLIYIPFDTCEFKLGGSLLAEGLGATPAVGPDIGDADYLIDCYEVVRELVEDGIVKAGVTVGEGGLALALRNMLPEGCGATADISGIMKAYGEDSPVRVLFSEVPGVLIQIGDADYDYVDAELMLQDVAYFPIAHPSPGNGPESLAFRYDGSGGISGILEPLLNTRTSEGED